MNKKAASLMSSCANRWMDVQNKTTAVQSNATTLGTIAPGFAAGKKISQGQVNQFDALKVSITDLLNSEAAFQANNCINQTPTNPASLSVSPTSVLQGATIQVNFANVTTPAVGDWLGIFPSATADDSAYVDWVYTSSGTKTKGSIPLATGSWPWVMGFTPGPSYELRLFRADTLVHANVPPAVFAITALPATGGSIHAGDIAYLGTFRYPAASGGTYGFEYADRGLAFNPANNSLFVTNHAYEGKVAEISIPGYSADYSALPQATLLQPLADVTEGHSKNIAAGGAVYSGSVNRGALFVHGGKLHGTEYGYYDAGEAYLSHFTHDINLSASSFAGMFKVGSLNPGFYMGYMCDVPPEWQAQFGGPILIGGCCIPVITRTSFGPAAFVIDPSGLGSTPLPAVPLVYYTQDHATLGQWGDPGPNPIFNATTQITGIVFPTGSSSVLFIGNTGLGPYCYGEAVDCGDPEISAKGPHQYPYVAYVWAYSAGDLLAVKNGTKQPWEVVPYQTWQLPLPAGLARILGAVYDASTQRLYVAQGDGEGFVPGLGWTSIPVMHIYQLTIH